ncbi:restriction endonuclease subunit S [Capnocytophaga canimorsus]|uniref:Restriction endonuclease subunit S n=1 Tax=Capnocytophaga canimorsus TaxID=28188 RepID=A0AAC9Z1H8_9FLAO|nr:restriction endonuclease subunit S [Capnocytophaga canimorsus]ATA93064.1 restriction endonuclease subunit S [Capnocytophaga canimorsus]
MQVAKINSSSITTNSFMLKPNFHMNFGKRRIERAIKQGLEFKPLGEVVNKVFTGGIFKRVFVDDAEYGLPYISAQHMMNSNPLDVAKIISKKYTPRQDDMSLKENQILVSCAGTVGNIKLITKDLEGVIGSQDIIRIDSDNNKLLYGYLYAFLSSKTAYAYIQSFIYGSVVSRIEPNTLRKLPIPILPEEFQQRVHNLIVDSAQLRVEANKLLSDAKDEIFKEIEIDKSKKNLGVNVSNINQSHHKRFEATYFKSKGSDYRNQIKKYSHKKLKELTEKIFRPGIFKRNYVQDGIEFLGGADITNAIPKSEKKLVKARTLNFKDLTLKEDWILVTCGGTIGTTVLVNNYLSQKLASQHILRVVAKDIPIGYLFAFLNSDIGVEMMQSLMYGSVIQQIEPHHLELLPIPILDNKTMLEIHQKVMNYKVKLNTAILKELEAIDLIEKEIDQWQQS